MHLIIFSTVLTPRVKYIFNFIFKEILKTELELTTDRNYFLHSKNFQISYGEAPLAKELFFKQTPLLFSNKLDEFKVKSIPFGEYLAPFPVSNSALPFDVFAASFFMITRYEEYWFQKKLEEHFTANKSLQHKWKVLDKPIIDEWAFMIKNMIKTKIPDFKFPEKKFTQQPTINLDILTNAPTGFVKKTKFLFSAVFNKDNKYLNTQYDRITGIGIHNKNVLTELQSDLLKRNINPIYFLGFPHASINDVQMDDLSGVLKEKAVGILRPCADGKKNNDIKSDLQQLKTMLPKQANLISQQLEILKFPICYLSLLNTGITSDYSMGYADTPGFRAGTCTPFNWYDLQLEKLTPLHINSYCITDTVFKYMNLEESKRTILFFKDAVKVVDGSFLSSWELRSLSGNLKYKTLKTLFNLIFSKN